MTYYPNRHDLIETDDIQKVQHVHIAKEGNNLIAHIKVILDPRKDYQAAKQVFLHLTNGINHAVHGPFEHSKPVSTSTSQESSTSTEVTEQSNETSQESEVQAPTTEQPTESTEATPSITEG